MKASRKFTLAIMTALTALSAAAVATGTVAWFTANSVVDVTGMNIQAKSEEGIVIANETHTAHADWNTSVTASHDGDGNSFVPTSTLNTTNWYHGLAANADDGQTDETVAAITPVDNIPAADPAPAYGTADDGIYGFLDGASWKNIYLLNSFFIQSSSVNAISNQDIYVRDFAAQVGNTAPAQDLSRSLRVAVTKHGTATPIIVAPVTNATAAYSVGPVDSKAACSAYTVTNVDTMVLDSAVSIPAYDVSGVNALQYDVFIYFEGEDVNCKSSNIEATLEQIAVSFKFGNKNHVGA